MSIPKWITDVTSEEKLKQVNFQDETYDKLLSMYKSGELEDWAAEVVEEVEYLRDVMNTAVANAGGRILKAGADCEICHQAINDEDSRFLYSDRTYCKNCFPLTKKAAPEPAPRGSRSPARSRSCRRQSHCPTSPW